MSDNQIAVIDHQFAVSRVTKSGKTQSRSLLGVITSGNKEERTHVFAIAYPRLIANNTFGPIMRELVRVFPPSGLKSKDTNGLVVINGELYVAEGRTFAPFNASAVDLASVAAYARAVVAKHGGKELKGEKALYIQAARAVVERANERQAAIDAQATADAE